MWQRIRRSTWWPWLLRALKWAFFLAVAYLLIQYARQLDWNQVAESALQYPGWKLVLGAALGLTCVAIYASYDQISRAIFMVQIKRWQSFVTAFTCYSFNLNLGALIGGVGLRYRLYSRYGVKAGTVSRMLGFAWLTNWLAYGILAGSLFVTGVVALPASWGVPGWILPLIGGILLLLVCVYLWMVLFRENRILTLGEHRIELPDRGHLAIQCLVGILHWVGMSVIIYLFMPQGVSYFQVFGVLMVSAVAALLTHVPSGLGVLEAVFIAMLGDQIGHPQIIAALLVYRVSLYLVPLALGLLGLIFIETSTRESANEDGSDSDFADQRSMATGLRD